MSRESASLARSITRDSSKQSYIIARLLADRELTDDCQRAYAYFRWADDVIDVSSRSAESRLTFIKRQKELIDRLYRGERPGNLAPEEEMIADLIAHDRGQDSGLQSFIRNFTEVLEFDAGRKGKAISQSELTWYSHCLGRAVTDAIQYFIGNNHRYSDSNNRYLAATAAHITHMLRDMVDDLDEGFINVPHEWLGKNHSAGGQPWGEHLGEKGGAWADMLTDPAFRSWVRGQVELAWAYFRDGKVYLDQMAVLRCKIAAYWYCARFECVLDAIERDGYVLRRDYRERSRLATKFRMGWIAISITFQHLGRRFRRDPEHVAAEPGLETPAAEH